MRILVLFIVLPLLLVAYTTKASEKNVVNNTMQFFSANYIEARQKFLSASRDTGALLEHFQSPHKGPQEELLYTDVAFLGDNESGTIIVISSGTHGVEGFTGSAIQSYLLKEFPGELPPNTGLLFIHCINPYGFAHIRRFNENNIDLNRNFIDHSVTPPSNPDYDELADAINPKSLSMRATAKSSAMFIWYALTKGVNALKKAISAGQYNHPRGLFYGGQQETWSNNTLRKIADRYLCSAKRVVIIDFHTGLGQFADAEIIMNEPEQSPAYKRAVSWWGEMVRTTVTGDSVSTHTQGSLKLAWPDMLPNSEITAVSLEFGTLSALKVFWALRKENWLHHHGGKDHPRAIEIKKKLLQAFYPEDYEWRKKVLEESKSVVKKLLQNVP